MSQIYISGETDPYFNVATEYQLFLQAEQDVSLFLWQNNPTVIFGRNQNAYAECDLNYLEKQGIVPVRRFSGGGAVFQDLGNVNFTFITKEECADPETYLSIIQKALGTLEVECSFSGRNDLLYQNKKFSGHAYFVDNGNYLYHGTLMIDVDMDLLSKSLSPSLLKLQSKGISSVRSRVINLVEVNQLITVETVKEAMVTAFKKAYGEEIAVQNLYKQTFLPNNLDKIQDKTWIFGESPAFSISLEQKMFFGNVILSADVENGRVQQLKIYTDSLYALDFSKFEKEWEGKLFQVNEIFDQVHQYVQRIC